MSTHLFSLARSGNSETEVKRVCGSSLNSGGALATQGLSVVSLLVCYAAWLA